MIANKALIIRRALLRAIKWDESLLHTFEGVSDYDQIRENLRKNIVSYKALLTSEYGGVPEDPMKDAISVDIRDIK